MDRKPSATGPVPHRAASPNENTVTTSTPPPGPETVFENVNPIELLSSLVEQYGDFVRYQTHFGTTTLVNDPAAIRHILYHPELFERSQVLAVVLGDGLLASEGQYWRFQRRNYQPKFHAKALESYAAAMAEEAEITNAEWEVHQKAGTPLELGNEMMKYSLRVASRVFLGDRVGSGKPNQRFCDATSAVVNFLGQMGNTIPIKYNPEDNRRQRIGVGLLEEVIAHFVERRREKAEGEDLLGLLLNLKDEQGNPALTPLQVRDEVATILLGGHETTSVAMTWAMWEMAMRPEIVTDLEAIEWSKVLGDRSPGWDDLMRLPKTQAMIRELLRYHPPVWSLVRHVTATTQLGPYTIPEGDNLLLSPYLAHRHKASWDKPEEFRLDRFADGIPKEYTKGCYIPFGAGPHMCIGQHVVNMEMMIALPIFLRKFKVIPTDSSDPGNLPMVTLRPARRIEFHLEKRTA